MFKHRLELDDLPAYDVVERPWEIKVNANECNLNLPPLVEERVMARLSRTAFNRYPNDEYDLLREEIAKSYGLSRENVLLGNGSSEIIEKLFWVFGAGAVLYPRPSFSMYGIYAKAAGAAPIPLELEDDFGLPKEKFLEAAAANAVTLAVVCNPNNPTGTAYAPADIAYLAENLACPLLVDEAYMEFYGGSAVGLLKKYRNLIIARTFSKAYGLAAARVGYMLASPDIVSLTAKAYMPYHLNVLSLVTADTVYQMRHEYLPRIEETVAERKRLAAYLAELSGFNVCPSETNFLLVKYDKAVELNEDLMAQKIGVRSFGAAPRLENCLRISVGTAGENDRVLKAIKSFVERES